jgi:tetratricopeptide (TPR) repeat protein
VRYVLDRDDSDAVEGVIETCEPPHRLVMSWRVLYDAEMAIEPPSRVEWTLTPANDDGTVTRVTLRHGDLAFSPKTWSNVRLGWVQVIDGLKTLLETGSQLPDVDADAHAVDPAEIEGGWHRSEAVAASNATWELLDGRDLTADEADELLGRAYAAAHHWRRAAGATVVNNARASWLLSRVHAVLGHGDVAHHHAQRCASLTAGAPDDMSDFDHAYVFEAQARALACLGRLDEAGEAYRRAKAVQIADDQDRTIMHADLAAEPWYGLER